jgi:hypothetical protein
MTTITGTLHEDPRTFIIISRWIFPRMRNISDKSCRENQNTHFMFNHFSRKSCRLWDNVEKYGRARQTTDDNIIRRMRFASWITKATDTHSEYVILIAFPRQLWLRERASILSYTYIDSYFYQTVSRTKQWSACNRIRQGKLAAVTTNTSVVWDITLCSLAYMCLVTTSETSMRTYKLQSVITQNRIIFIIRECQWGLRLKPLRVGAIISRWRQAGSFTPRPYSLPYTTKAKSHQQVSFPQSRCFFLHLIHF